MGFLMKRWSCSMMLFKVTGGTDNADRDRENPLTPQCRGHRRDAQPRLQPMAGPRRFPIMPSAGTTWLPEVSLRRQHKIYRPASAIHRSIQVRPLTGDADVRLIHAPGTIGAAEFAAKPLIQNRRETPDPTPDRDMVPGEAALRRYFFQIPGAERIPQVPADTQ